MIEKERPDALLATLGGQTALNTAIALARERRPREVRRRADRRLASRRSTAARTASRSSRSSRSSAARSPTSRHLPHPGRAARRRPTSSATRWSSGRRSRWAAPARAWRTTRPTCAASAAAGSRRRPTSEVLLEESILGWKEYELEVMRDQADNVVIVCSDREPRPDGRPHRRLDHGRAGDDADRPRVPARCATSRSASSARSASTPAAATSSSRSTPTTAGSS